MQKTKDLNNFLFHLAIPDGDLGQLENEIKQNSWINLNEELDLLFEVEPEKKWKNALQKTGIDFSKLTNFYGNA